MSSIRREHGEPIESGGGGQALQVGARHVDRPQVELASPRIPHVRREDDARLVGKERRRERRRVQIGDLHGVASVRLGDPELELGRSDQPLPQQRLVAVALCSRSRPRGAPDDVRAVAVEEGPAVVTDLVGQPANVAAVGVHPIELQIAVADRGEHDRSVDGTDRGLRVISRGVGQTAEIRAVAAGAKNVVARVDCPHVALPLIRPRRTGRPCQVCRREDHIAGVRQEERAGGGAGTARYGDRHGSRPGRTGGGGGSGHPPQHVHAKDAIATRIDRARLKDQLRPIRGEVSLRVLAAEGELAQVPQVQLVGPGRDGLRSGSRWHRRRRGWRGSLPAADVRSPRNRGAWRGPRGPTRGDKRHDQGVENADQRGDANRRERRDGQVARGGRRHRRYGGMTVGFWRAAVSGRDGLFWSGSGPGPKLAFWIRR